MINISFTHSGFNDAVHKSIKQNYRKSSRRKRSVINEPVRSEKRFIEHQQWFLEQCFKRSRVIASFSKVAKEDGAYNVRPEAFSTLLGLERCVNVNLEQKGVEKFIKTFLKPLKKGL